MLSLPRPLGFVPAAVALPLAPVLPQAAAGAAVAVAVLAAPVEIPLLAAVAIGLGVGLAVGLAWEALNSNLEESGTAGDYLFRNNSNTTKLATFRAYQDTNWPPGTSTWTALVGKESELYRDYPWINGWAAYNWMSVSFALPPGSSGGSLIHHLTGSPIPNSRNDYWECIVNGVSEIVSITGYAPGYKLAYATLMVPDDVEVSSNGAIIAKPNTLTPQAFKEDETPKRISPPLPFLPASVPDIGTPVTPSPATTPGDPLRKEDPKAPPNLFPAEVPIWQPGPSPSKSPSPAGVPLPGRNPQTIPSTNPARPNVAFDVAALPIPQVAPAVKPTSTTAHQVGNLTIPARAPQATMQGIADEVGRIEQKLSIILNPASVDNAIDWMENLQEIWEFLQAVSSGGEYTLTSPCEVDDNGERIVKTATYSGGLTALAALSSKIDALAELMQHGKDLKQPNCDEQTTPRSTVTVTAYEVMES